MERVQREANEVFNTLAKQFYDEFIGGDPEGYDVANMKKQVCAKWKMFCKREKLKEEALPLMQEFCENLEKEYKKELAE